jgi:hypothetical protein
MKVRCRISIALLSLFTVLSSIVNHHGALAWLLPQPQRARRRRGSAWSSVRSSPSIARHLYLNEGYDPYNGTKPFFNTTFALVKTTEEEEKTSSSNKGNFGDIMSPTSDDADLLLRDGLVTSENYSLAQIYGIHHPLDRMAVTANGNLQRLFSSYYDAPVRVLVDYSRQSSRSEWDRRVHLTVFNQTFCTADSRVQVHNKESQELVQSGKVGLGQLFRYLDILPEFSLQAAGPTPEGGFWRNYTLDCSLVTCSIHEVFCPGAWNLNPNNNE